VSAPSTVQWLRAAVHRIAVGSSRRATYLTAWAVHRARRVWDGACGWLNEGHGFGWWLRAGLLLVAAAILRKITTAIGIGIYHRIANGGAPVLCWGAAAWWTVSAYRAGADGWKPKRPAAPEPTAESAENSQGQTAPAPGQPPPATPSLSPVALFAAVRDIGTPHAQLKPLAEHLGTTTDAVRAAAGAAGWPVKDVRMDGRSSSAGLRWNDCPSPTILAPSSDVVGAGERADDNDDDTPSEEPRKGLRVVRTDHGSTYFDLADTHRRHQARGH
jgi:hypothetical protein